MLVMLCSLVKDGMITAVLMASTTRVRNQKVSLQYNLLTFGYFYSFLYEMSDKLQNIVYRWPNFPFKKNITSDYI